MPEFAQRQHQIQSRQLVNATKPDQAKSQSLHASEQQQTLGNQAMQRLLRSGAIQAKLTEPGDKYEQEADRVAEQVMRMPGTGVSGISKGAPNIQRACAACASGKGFCPTCATRKDGIQRKPLAQTITPLIQCQSVGLEEEEEEGLQAKEVPGQTPTVTPHVEARINAMCGGGQPLPKSVRSDLEPRFGHDFSNVRIHTGPNAAEAAQAVNARAFTVGRNIIFGAGQYSPKTATGKRLLAHEFTHVVQQNSRSDGLGIRVQRSPDTSVWGGFRIRGNQTFIAQVRSQLNTLNATSQGRAVLGAINTNRSPLYRALIPIRSGGACGFLPSTGIMYNTSGCVSSNRCTTGDPGWVSVPNHVYLFHEVVHTYLYYIADKGTHPERECMATGLGGYFLSIPYNENRLRCELNLPIRPCYNGVCRGFAAPTCDMLNQTSSASGTSRTEGGN